MSILDLSSLATYIKVAILPPYMKNKYGLDLRYIVLKLLSKSPMHGYMLASEILKQFGKKPSNGTLNPLFARLEKEGLIDSYETIEHGKYKKIYSISAAGKEWLEKKTAHLKKFINY